MAQGQGKQSGGVVKTFFVAIILIAMLSSPYFFGVAKTGSFDPKTALTYTFNVFGNAGGNCLESTLINSKECKLVAPGVGGGNVGTGAGGKLPEAALPNKPANKTAEAVTAYGKALDTLKVSKDEDAEFKTEDWNVWAINSDGCTTRAEVLKNQGKDVATKDGDPASCDITAGTWVGAYDGNTFTVKPGENPTELRKHISVDPIISNKYANSHGAKGWDAEKKSAFANDTTQLVVASTESAKAKDGKSPAEYMPQASEQCHYSQMWIDTATKYNLSISQADKNALQKGLQTCNA